MPRSVTSPESCLARARGGSPGHRVGWKKAAMMGSPVLLLPGALAIITVLSLQSYQRVPSLGDLTATLQLGERCPPPSSRGRKAALAPSSCLPILRSWKKDVCHALCPCPNCQAWPQVATGQRCACLQARTRGVCVSQPGTSGGGQVQTLWSVGREEVIWGPAVEKLSVCD